MKRAVCIEPAILDMIIACKNEKILFTTIVDHISSQIPGEYGKVLLLETQHRRKNITFGQAIALHILSDHKSSHFRNGNPNYNPERTILVSKKQFDDLGVNTSNSKELKTTFSKIGEYLKLHISFLRFDKEMGKIVVKTIWTDQ